jgi:hypothetical protein
LGVIKFLFGLNLSINSYRLKVFLHTILFVLITHFLFTTSIYISLCLEDGSGFAFAQMWFSYWHFSTNKHSSVLSKRFKRLICAQFVDYLDSGDLLTPYQSEFHKFRSTAAALTKDNRWYSSGSLEVGIFDICSGWFFEGVWLLFRMIFCCIGWDSLLGLSSTACRMFGSFLLWLMVSARILLFFRRFYSDVLSMMWVIMSVIAGFIFYADDLIKSICSNLYCGWVQEREWVGCSCEWCLAKDSGLVVW